MIENKKKFPKSATSIIVCRSMRPGSVGLGTAHTSFVLTCTQGAGTMYVYLVNSVRGNLKHTGHWTCAQVYGTYLQ